MHAMLTNSLSGLSLDRNFLSLVKHQVHVLIKTLHSDKRGQPAVGRALS